MKAVQRFCELNQSVQAASAVASVPFPVNGSLRLPAEVAEDVLDQMEFVEDCLRQNMRELAYEVLAGLQETARNSPSLLFRILLDEVSDLVRSPGSVSRQLLAVISLKARILRRCPLERTLPPPCVGLTGQGESHHRQYFHEKYVFDRGMENA